MGTLRLIAYDLKKESTSEDYKGFMKIIKSYAWARLSESSYAVDTIDTPSYIYARLQPYIDANDCVLVMTLTRPYHGKSSQLVLDWLAARL